MFKRTISTFNNNGILSCIKHIQKRPHDLFKFYIKPGKYKEFCQHQLDLKLICTLSNEEKLFFLLKNHSNTDLNDLKLNLKNGQDIVAFCQLVQFGWNFNDNEIKGIGTLMMSISKSDSEFGTGLEALKSCGLLDEENENKIKDIFLNRYSRKMQEITIELLQHRDLPCSEKFLIWYCDKYNDDRALNFKLHVKLQKGVIENTEVDFTHSEIRHLLKNYLPQYLSLLLVQPISVKEKLDHFLNILFSYLDTLNQRDSQKIGSMFLSLISDVGDYDVHLSYFTNLYLNEETVTLLNRLGLLRIDDTRPKGLSQLKCWSKISTLSLLPEVNIDSRMIQKLDAKPFNQDIARLFHHYLKSQKPKSEDIKLLFKQYLKTARYFENEILLRNGLHSFNYKYHSPDILFVFLEYLIDVKNYARSGSVILDYIKVFGVERLIVNAQNNGKWKNILNKVMMRLVRWDLQKAMEIYLPLKNFQWTWGVYRLLVIELKRVGLNNLAMDVWKECKVERIIQKDELIRLVGEGFDVNEKLIRATAVEKEKPLKCEYILRGCLDPKEVRKLLVK